MRLDDCPRVSSSGLVNHPDAHRTSVRDGVGARVAGDGTELGVRVEGCDASDLICHHDHRTHAAVVALTRGDAALQPTAGAVAGVATPSSPHPSVGVVAAAGPRRVSRDQPLE